MKLGFASAGALFIWLNATEVLGQPACAANAAFKAVDMHQPVTRLRAGGNRTGVAALRDLGIATIIRYYDWDMESIACKTLLSAEVDEILANGLSIAVVFQHNNDDPETFIDPSRGQIDAKRSLLLADANGQPYGTTIYFGVDGVDQAIASMVWEYSKSLGGPISETRQRDLVKSMGASGLRKHKRFYDRFLDYHKTVFAEPVAKLRGRDMLPFVKAYFEAVAVEFERATPGNRYDVGAYGSGLVCEYLLANKLAKRCWLAQSRGWPGYEKFRDSGAWSLLQQLPTKCPGWTYQGANDPFQFDFNEINPAKPDFGQWSSKRARTANIAPPKTCVAN